MKENKKISNKKDLSESKVDSTQRLDQLRFWTSDSAAEYLNVSKSYLYALVRTRQIPHYRPIEGGKIWFLEADLKDWMIGSKVIVTENRAKWTEDDQRKFIRGQLG